MDLLALIIHESSGRFTPKKIHLNKAKQNKQKHYP